MEKIFYILRASFGHIKQNPMLNILTVTTLTVAFLIFNTSLLFFLNLHGLVKKWQKSFAIIAYLKQDATEASIREAMALIKNMPLVSELEFVGKEEALKRFQKELGENSYLLDGIDKNPFPAYFLITPGVNDEAEKNLENMLESIKNIDVIDEVQYGRELIRKFVRALSAIKILSSMLNIFILIAVVFIVSNTIRLSLFSRKDEIEIMRLVGASDAFIGAPYIIEAAWQGFVSVTLSFSLLYLLYHSVFLPLIDSISFLFGLSGFHFYQFNQVTIIVCLSVAVAVLDSYVSMRRFLKV